MRFYRDGDDWVFEDGEESKRFSNTLANKEDFSLRDFLESLIDEALQERAEKLKKTANLERLYKQEELFDLLEDDRLDDKRAEILNVESQIEQRIEGFRTNLKGRLIEAWQSRERSPGPPQE